MPCLALGRLVKARAPITRRPDDTLRGLSDKPPPGPRGDPFGDPLDDAGKWLAAHPAAPAPSPSSEVPPLALDDKVEEEEEEEDVSSLLAAVTVLVAVVSLPPLLPAVWAVPMFFQPMRLSSSGVTLVKVPSLTMHTSSAWLATKSDFAVNTRVRFRRIWRSRIGHGRPSAGAKGQGKEGQGGQSEREH